MDAGFSCVKIEVPVSRQFIPLPVSGTKQTYGKPHIYGQKHRTPHMQTSGESLYTVNCLPALYPI